MFHFRQAFKHPSIMDGVRSHVALPWFSFLLDKSMAPEPQVPGFEFFAERDARILFEERYWKQWAALGFSPEGHPMQFLRDALAAQGVGTCADLQSAKSGQQVRVGGLVTRIHKPPTAKGVVFFSLSDETALAHVAVMPGTYNKIASVVYGGGPVVATGRAEKRGEGVSLLAEDIVLIA